MKMTSKRKRSRFVESGIERLETREVLSHMVTAHAHLAHHFHLHAPAPATVVSPVKVSTPVVTTNLVRTPALAGNGPMEKLGKDLIAVYQAYLKNLGDPSSLKTSFPTMSFNGNKVSINVQTKADVNVFAAELVNLGMDVSLTSAKYGWVSGDFPISQLPTLASLPDTLSGQPAYKPITSGFMR
jgi:hypothetical protein